MSSLESSKFMLGLKLPNSFYEALKQSKNLSGELRFDPSSLELEIKPPPGCKNCKVKYFSRLEIVQDTIVFSVDSNRTPRFKGNIKYIGSLLQDQSTLPRIDTLDLKENKPQICVNDPSDEIPETKHFKLHELHDIYTMSNQDQAIDKKIRKILGFRLKKDSLLNVKTKILRLFNFQKYWKLKNLSDETGQPEYYIREIMKSIGKKVKTGPYTSYWELSNP